MAVVVFDIAEFRARYPQFADISDGQLSNYFDLATLYLDNTDSSIITDVNELSVLLYMLVCHLATLSSRGDDLVGNLTSASEGSVSAGYQSIDWGSGKWYGQTQCGAMFWAATTRYRSGGRYYAYRKS